MTHFFNSECTLTEKLFYRQFQAYLFHSFSNTPCTVHVSNGKKGSPRLDPAEFQTRGLLAVSDPLFRFYCQGYFTPWVIIIRKDFTIFQRQNKKARVVSKKVCISFPEFWVLKKRRSPIRESILEMNDSGISAKKWTKNGVHWPQIHIQVTSSQRDNFPILGCTLEGVCKKVIMS